MDKRFIYFNTLFIIVFLFTSCANEKQLLNNAYPVLDLDQATRVDSLKLSSLFSNVKTIILDKSNKALIGGISRVEFCEDNIFILDENIAKTVFIFNKEGEFIRQIGCIGQGKGEYMSPADFTLDRIKKHIFILDRQQKKIHEYNYTTGEHLSSVNIPKYSSNIFYYKDAIYTDYPGSHATGTDYIFRKSNAQNGKEIDLLLTPETHNKGWTFTLANNDGIFLSRSSESPVLTHLFMDTVYHIEQKGVFPHFVIKSKSMMNKKDIEGLNVDKNFMDLIELVKRNKYYNLQTYMENYDFIFFQLQKGAMPYPIYYDKNNENTLKGDLLIEDILFNNLDFKLTQFRFGGCDANGAFFYLTPDRISEFNKLKELGKYPNLSPKIESEFENREDTFNGAIFYYEYKK